MGNHMGRVILKMYSSFFHNFHVNPSLQANPEEEHDVPSPLNFNESLCRRVHKGLSF
jgi:hypothetical protein